MLGVNCPKYIEDYRAQTLSPKQQAEYGMYKDTMAYISKYSGLNVTTFLQVYQLYFGVSTESEYGLKLPKWLEKIWPQNITEIAIREYGVATATTTLRQMASGYLLKKIIEDTRTKINEDPDTEFKKKIYLYSAHESNVAHFLITLDLFKPHIPNYGAYVILEVHKIDEVYGVKVRSSLILIVCEIICCLCRYIIKIM